MVLRLTLILLLAGCASTTPYARIDQLTSTRAVWAIDVEDDSGRVLYAQNAHKLMVPASNRKLFSTALASECLGLDHRFTTELWRDGDDLVLRGGGDPSFGGRYYASPGDAFAPMLGAVHARGITHVHDVVADPSAFDRQTIPPSWKIGNLPYDYSAPVDALAYHENAIDDDFAIPDPALHAARALRDLLVFDGITIEGDVRIGVAKGERIAAVDSPPLSELLATTLKVSQNLYAEMLFKNAGGGYYVAAVDRERRFVRELGIDPNDIRFVDGSGLSPDDLAAPAAIVRLMRWMNAPERRGAWWSILATPNEEGTLHRRLTELQSRLRGKTGTLEGVSALSGIIAMPRGGYRYFSIIVDHNTTPNVNRTIDEIARLIAE
ncbi:MAG TPA: D-alanyl-D-alanine carboxypeptidase [Thermoanaerobaculia bacterium]|nr:D-alanyl-D-alanine carboxypeptidase [Thermoanaerobaculia bacterium]